VCVKERNRLATDRLERQRLDAGYGEYENRQRDKTVQETMKAILDTLAERHQAYQEAYMLAQRDTDIDLSRTVGPQYIQPTYDPLEADDAPYTAEAEAPVEEVTKDKTLPDPEVQSKEKANHA
jgi:large subunit ribosomal protein L47